VESQINNSVGVTPFVIVPGNQLNEVRAKRNTGLSIEDRASVISDEVLTDNLFFSISQNTLKFTFRSVLNSLAQFFVGGTLFESNGQIDDGDIVSGDSEGHTSQLALKTGDDLTDGLSSTSRGGDDVTTSGSTSSPVLTTLGGTIDDQLGSSGGVDGGHETFNDAVFVVDDLGEGSKAVGGARGVGEDGDVGLVLLLVDAHDEHGGIGGGSGDDDLLGTTLQVEGSLLVGGEDTGGLDDVLGALLRPGDVGGVTLGVEGDLLAVDNEVLAGDLDLALEDTVGGVVLEHVGGVLGLNEGVVHGDDVDVLVLDGVAEDDATNAAETVDTDLWRTIS